VLLPRPMLAAAALDAPAAAPGGERQLQHQQQPQPAPGARGAQAHGTPALHGSLPLLPPLPPVLLDRATCTYTSHYCEENALLLSHRLVECGAVPGPAVLYVVIISNPRRQVRSRPGPLAAGAGPPCAQARYPAPRRPLPPVPRPAAPPPYRAPPARAAGAHLVPARGPRR
jgi:hypothetical protein